MILCLGTTPAAQRVMVFRQLTIDQVNRAVTTLDGAAGKSINVAKVLRAIGEEPFAVGVCGGARGSQISAALSELGVAFEFVPVRGATRECVTVIDQAAGTITELVEESAPMDAAEAGQLIDLVRRRMAGARAVVMSGTIAPGCPVDLYAQVTSLAHGQAALTVVDAQGPALVAAVTCKPDLVKPNRGELATTLGKRLDSEAEVIAAAREFHERGAKRVVVTAGSQPTLAFDGRNAWRVLSPALQAVNPIGSGDAFTAGVTARLARGDDLGEACRWGTAAGGANALRLMAGEVRMADVRRLLAQVRVDPIPC